MIVPSDLSLGKGAFAMEPLRAAVIGVGFIGSLHARIYAEHPRTVLVAVADVNPERARQVGETLKVRWYTNVEDLLAHEAIDIVSVATPEQHRYATAVPCAQAGKHLLLEKPLAPTLTEADQLIQTIDTIGVKATVNFILRSDPRYFRAKQAMVDGTIGEPCTFFARRRGTVLGAEYYGPWTDLLISTAIHDLDLMVWLNGSPVVEVYARAVVKRCAQWGHWDAVMGLLQFENGAIGSFETSWVLPPTMPALLDASLHVVGTRGGVFIDGTNNGLAIVSQDGYSLPDLTHWPIGPTGIEGDLRAHIDRFIRYVLDEEPPVITLQEARYAQEIVAALAASLRQGQPVRLPYSEDSA
jgi:predicted dehydrogenase